MKVALSLHASKLKNVAGTFKGTSDPFAVVTMMDDSSHSRPVVLGKTEVIKNNLSPDWAKRFVLEHNIGKPTNVSISIFDEVRKGKNISMGSAIFEVGSIVGAKGSTKAKKLKKGGVLYARIDNAKDFGSIKLKLSGKGLKNVEGFMGKSDPFFELRRKDVGASGTMWNTIYRSKQIKNNLNPSWDEDTIDLDLLCSGDYDLRLLLVVYDHEKSGKHKPMGQVETSVNGLVNASNASSSMKIKTKGKETGVIIVHKAVVSDPNAVTSLSERMQEASISAPSPSAPPSSTPNPSASAPNPSAPPPFAPNPSAPPPFAPNPSAPPPFAPTSFVPTFMDYVRGGCKINLLVAIDFTGSNGDPRKPGTLHYQNRDGNLNDYESAITSIGSILQNYDEDKKYPVWGFGAKFGGTLYHCFQCGPQTEVDGVSGVLGAYRSMFQSGFVMSSPTVLTEVIATAAAFASTAQENAMRNNEQAYNILLILTDGGDADVVSTNACLDSISDSPLSIVIVGIGHADFSAMRFLDDRTSMVDNVQFVEFNRYRHDKYALTQATLDEIPGQLEHYFIRHGIMPLSPTSIREEEIVIEPEEEEIDLSLAFDGNQNAFVPQHPGGF